MTAGCSRCNGLLVGADLADGIGTPAARRCIACGDVVDALILHHRRQWREPYSDATAPQYKATKSARAML